MQSSGSSLLMARYGMPIPWGHARFSHQFHHYTERPAMTFCGGAASYTVWQATISCSATAFYTAAKGMTCSSGRAVARFSLVGPETTCYPETPGTTPMCLAAATDLTRLPNLIRHPETSIQCNWEATCFRPTLRLGGTSRISI